MRNTWKAVMVAGLLVAGAAQGAQAQQALRMVTFQAPFAFEVEHTKLPAGNYTILVQSGWVQIQTKNGKSTTQVLTLPVASQEQKTVENSHVVFHNYAGRMFLAEIWASGQEKGRELLESREEQQLAKKEKMAAVNVPANLVARK
jgi:hypothetical protein